MNYRLKDYLVKMEMMMIMVVLGVRLDSSGVSMGVAGAMMETYNAEQGDETWGR